MSRRRRLQLYFALLTLQTVGVAILLVNMIPLYRMMVLDFANYKPDLRPWWAFAGVLLIQVAYWLRVRLQPSLPGIEGTVLGHLILFAARMSFVTVTAGFTVMFLNRIEDLRRIDYPPVRALIVLAISFSLFCWTLELERLGKALQRDKS